MTNLKKIGLTALAGTLAATTFAQAGGLSVSGNAIMEYQTSVTEDTTHSSDDNTDGFVMNSTLTFSGSGELDNGMTVSMYQSLASGAVTSEGVTLDMGDMGKISLDRWGYHGGITSVADKVPTAAENVHDDTFTSNHDNPAVGVAKTGYDGSDVFTYKMSGDSFTFSTSSSASTSGSENSVALSVTAMEGLEFGGGFGTDNSSATNQDDLTTMYAKYTMGPVSIGVQTTEIEAQAASSDIDADHYGISFAVNENLSVSYGEHTVDFESSTTDEESTGFSASYSAGSMSFTLVNNTKDGAAGTAKSDHEMVELKMIMAF